MEKENKHYHLIESIVKEHKKYPGLESILDDIIDDVYSHSEVILNSVTNESVVRAYLEKVVSTSLITVSKRLGYRSNNKAKTAPVNNNLIEKNTNLQVNKHLVDKMINNVSSEDYTSFKQPNIQEISSQPEINLNPIVEQHNNINILESGTQAQEITDSNVVEQEQNKNPENNGNIIDFNTSKEVSVEQEQEQEQKHEGNTNLFDFNEQSPAASDSLQITEEPQKNETADNIIDFTQYDSGKNNEHLNDTLASDLISLSESKPAEKQDEEQDIINLNDYKAANETVELTLHEDSSSENIETENEEEKEEDNIIDLSEHNTTTSDQIIEDQTILSTDITEELPSIEEDDNIIDLNIEANEPSDIFETTAEETSQEPPVIELDNSITEENNGLLDLVDVAENTETINDNNATSNIEDFNGDQEDSEIDLYNAALEFSDTDSDNSQANDNTEIIPEVNSSEGLIDNTITEEEEEEEEEEKEKNTLDTDDLTELATESDTLEDNTIAEDLNNLNNLNEESAFTDNNNLEETDYELNLDTDESNEDSLLQEEDAENSIIEEADDDLDLQADSSNEENLLQEDELENNADNELNLQTEENIEEQALEEEPSAVDTLEEQAVDDLMLDSNDEEVDLLSEGGNLDDDIISNTEDELSMEIDTNLDEDLLPETDLDSDLLGDSNDDLTLTEDNTSNELFAEQQEFSLEEEDEEDDDDGDNNKIASTTTSTNTSTDYSVFSFVPKNEGLEEDLDIDLIVNDLATLDEKNPDLNILKIYNLKYKDNQAIPNIASELNMNNDKVIEALNEIISVI